jgi:hypothetical protein
MELTYIDSDNLLIKDDYLPWQEQGLQQTTSGYGNKLTTTRKLFYNNRWYRIYAICYSNCGSCYILVKGERMFLR